MSFIGLEDSVVISRGELHIVPCERCELIQCEHDGRDTACDEFYPDVEAAEERYIDENEWKIDAETVADKIGVPLDQWEGNCAGIACLLLEHDIGDLPEGTVDVHGMWLGPISKRSKVFGGKAASQHHWLALPGLWIVDPTRWCFEGLRPYIFYGMDEDEYYDEGANRFNAAFRIDRPYPEIDAKDRLTTLDFGEANDVISLLTGITPIPPAGFLLTAKRAMWIANLSYDAFDGKAKIVYDVLESASYGAYIPLDNRLRADQGR